MGSDVLHAVTLSAGATLLQTPGSFHSFCHVDSFCVAGVLLAFRQAGAKAVCSCELMELLIAVIGGCG